MNELEDDGLLVRIAELEGRLAGARALLSKSLAELAVIQTREAKLREALKEIQAFARERDGLVAEVIIARVFLALEDDDA
jgi:hypothetical protein